MLLLITALFMQIPALAGNGGLSARFCEFANNLPGKLSEFSQDLKTPVFDKQCLEAEVPKDCQDFKNSLKLANEDWRSYLSTCEKSNSIGKHLQSCSSFFQMRPLASPTYGL